ncbi:hypothetical protein yc1106_06262 [Curvularia clavata]|uniref:C2H2-type domain-containing protein n=1 Tax=Curvularia clavata TaxID=95742 RepID=A0A9Q8ZE05_CURCL|nr:hypothetical protein yc1106_06262 [Curvularia clavata]
MSEPSETGGLPLDPTTNQLQGNINTSPPPSSSSSPPPTSIHASHFKTLSSPKQTKGPRKNSPRRRLENTQQEPLVPRTSSARSDRLSTASPVDMASQMSPVHYTKTGRISKAKKGLKVHKCEICGKSYTRAEHLRRHKKNHTPDEALMCEIPGCGKVFHRMDLLVRHKERHNEVGNDSRRSSIDDPSAPLSVPTPAPEPPVISAAPNMTTIPYYQPVSPMNESAPPPRYNHVQFRTPRTPKAFSSCFSHVPRSSPQSIISPNQLKRHSFAYGRQSVQNPIPVDGNVPGLWHEPYSPNPGYSSSSGYVSPIAPTDYPLYTTPYHRTRTPSNASCIDQPGWSFASRSPASTTSTMAFTWPSTEKGHTAPGIAYMNTSCAMTTMPIVSSFDGMSELGHFGPKSMMQRDEEERAILFGDQQYGMPSIDSTYPFEQCLDYYWRLFHPTFPVVHRSTSGSSSPMLHAAMAAIGGQYSPSPNVKKQSRDLHDRCAKLLQVRDHEAMAEPDRLCDFQAIFLLEVVSQYRARRAGKVLSSRFDKVYHKAAEDCRRITQRLSDIVSSPEQLGDSSSDLWHEWIELASWQRLLLSCYILESQQPLLLARKPLPSLLQDPTFELPFPGHTSLWDAADLASWIAAARQHTYSPRYVYEAPESTSVCFDTFQSAVLLAAHYKCPEPPSSYISAPTVSSVEHLLCTSPVIMRMLSTAKLAQVTPLRALLAVSGESWILSEKVETPQLLATFKTTLRAWVTQFWSTPASEDVPVKSAMRLSVEILQQALQEQRLGVLPEMGTDMGIYFAALVLWVITVAATTRFRGLAVETTTKQGRTRGQSLSHPMPNSTMVVAAQAPSQGSRNLLAPNPPHSPIIAATPENPILTHAQITINTISFLNNAPLVFSDATTSAADLSRYQTGCVSLLLWVKLRLRGVSLDTQNSTADGLEARSGLGELLDGVTGSLERILRNGWSGWGI